MIQIVKERKDTKGNLYGIRGYKRRSDRKRAIRFLMKRGFDRFTYYQDTKADFAVMYMVS